MCRYVERVSEVLRQKLKQADILVLKGATMAEKRQEALEEQSRLEPRVDLLAGRTRELQKLVLDYYIHLFMFTGLVLSLLTQMRRLQEASNSETLYVYLLIYTQHSGLHGTLSSLIILIICFLQIEADISKRYHNRPVNLMGVII